MTERNRHGLPRTIPDPIAREIRQRCGFGCVNCGSAIYEYEHVDPPFPEAKSHDPNHIVLLCSSCHALVTKGLLSKETIKQRANHPKCLESGFSFGPFDVGSGVVEIMLGTILARDAKVLIRICGDDVFSIMPSMGTGRPFRINAFFCDSSGTSILSIVENEWRAQSTNWDVEVVGARISIRNGLRRFALVLRAQPPHRLVVERMNMAHKGIEMTCREGDAFAVTNSRGTTFTSIACKSDGWSIGVNANEHGIIIGTGGTTALTGVVTAQAGHTQGVVLGVLDNLRRLSLCPCGSTLWYKKCHGVFSSS